MSCIKCGSTNIHTRFHATGSANKRCGSDFFKGVYCKEQEHLYHYCRGCGYDWHTAPLDAQPTKAKTEELMRELENTMKSKQGDG